MTTWRAAYAGLMPAEALAAASIETRQQLWREGLASGLPPARETFVAVVDGEVVGFASVGECRDTPEHGELYAIYLDSRRWGAGVGRALLERSEESLRTSGFAAAVLWVLDGNQRAMRFYEAAGWERHDRKLDMFLGAEVVELGYRKTL